MSSNVYNSKEIIFSLLEESKELLQKITTANTYKDMSNAKIRSRCQISVKNIYENCHSVLDYTAGLINNTLHLGLKEEEIYFPIYYKPQKFKKNPMVAIVEENHPKLYTFLYSIQPFISGGENRWLKKFHSDNNTYKHRGFVRLRPFFKTKTLGWAQFGDMDVSVSEFSFSSGSPSILREKIDFENDRSIEFQFRLEDGITPVDVFLNDVINGIERIVNKIIELTHEKGDIHE